MSIYKKIIPGWIITGIFIFTPIIAQESAENPISPPDSQVVSPDPLASNDATQLQKLQAEQTEELKRIEAEQQSREQARREKLEALRAGEALSPELLQQAEVNLNSARLQLDNLELEKKDAQREAGERETELQTLKEQLRELKKQPVVEEQVEEWKARLNSLENEIERTATRKVLAEQRVEYLQHRLEQAGHRLEQAETWHGQLTDLHQARQNERLETDSQAIRQRQAEKLTELRERLEALPDDATPEIQWQRRLVETRIQEAEESTQLELRRLRLQHIEEQLEGWRTGVEALEESEQQRRLTELEGLIHELGEIDSLLQEKIQVLERQQSVMRLEEDSQPSSRVQQLARQTREILQELHESFTSQQQKARDLLAALKTFREETAADYAEQVQRTLMDRRELPDSRRDWLILAEEIRKIPAMFAGQLQASLEIARQDLIQLGMGGWLGGGLLALLWLSFLAWGNRWVNFRLRNLLQEDADREEQNFVHNSLSITLRLLRMNLGGVAVAGLLALLVWVSQPAQSTAFLILSLVVVWLGVKLPIDLAWLLLAAPDVPDDYRSPSLYRHLRWVLGLTGIFLAFTLLIHILPFSRILRDLNDSLFMLFISLLLLPSLFRIRGLALKHLATHEIRPRWLFTLKLVTLLLPISMLVVAGLALSGYINLGWAVARDLGWFILILSGWLILRGLFNDLVNYLRNYAVMHSNHYGLLWSQDIIPLLHKIARVLLILLAVGVFLRVTGWQTDTGILQMILRQALFTLGDTHITVGALLISGLALLIVFWLGSWSRQITFRWIYTGVSDIGLRNSLSAFTQYAVIFIGLLVTLNLIGLELTTLTVFAGAVGVGLGFGLQNIANNFVSGLLLLMERPLRAGDIVEIGGRMGEVSKIGIRSLTIKTWDSQDLIVPNSEFISNSFINLTHSDSLLRTVLMIGVSYESELRVAMEEIRQTLEKHPAVMKDPGYLVSLWEFADSAVTIRVHYYANLRQYSLLELRSEVLLDVFERFRAKGIVIPFPQRDVHLFSPQAVAEEPQRQVDDGAKKREL